jgi:hypothetical protein
VNPSSRIVIAVAVVAAVVGGFFLLRRRPPPPPPAAPTNQPNARAAPPAPVTPAPSSAPPSIRHPIEAAPSSSSGAMSPDESDAYLTRALNDLLGSKAVQSFLNVDGFARRLVGTANNLASDDASADLWPVRRTAGRFEVENPAGAGPIAAANAARYEAFVRLVDGIDTQRAVALYRRAYPLLQRAYEDIGFPGKYFNDRVVEVIDHLLATPDVDAPPRVKRVEVDGAPPGAPRFGALYVFEDPTLEARSTGQKILLRLGPDHARRLKAKLVEIRRGVAGS